MSIHPRNKNTNRYPDFNKLFNNTENSKVLDFGGNRGNLLYFSNGEIKENNYTSVDVSKVSIECGKKEFPDAKFIHYDRWSSMYNHKGNKKINFPHIDKNQEFIFSFSVFTHTDYDEFKKTLDWFDTFNYLMMANSILDIRNRGVVEWFYNKRVNDYGSCHDIVSMVDDPSINILYLLDNNKIIVNEEKIESIDTEHFLTFYDTDWLLNKLKVKYPSVEIKIPTTHSMPYVVIKKFDKKI